MPDNGDSARQRTEDIKRLFHTSSAPESHSGTVIVLSNPVFFGNVTIGQCVGPGSDAHSCAGGD